ncbi:hypothetical protein N7520_011991 [Penicillium odoratum]|uniref:uncharacterized protein n=1 Tax=Penicillium odoratum TaxID=1167516 RepID=UPI002548C18F|nr:uncharacterized protein N7520_011991 [Penicillium odoratum]KAJ5746809.1 hypothetical protein N7520_011991 [Penicillium odoratum]
MSEAQVNQQIANLLAFAGGKDTPSDAIFIAVMGVTGAGKSTLISQCTGQDVHIGHGLLSCTSEIKVFDFRLDGRKVYLIDTPGFDDSNFTERPDFVILQTISAYLSASYARGVYIHGVIFLHPIIENRMTGSARRNIELMKALCGSGFFPNVALATTHWSTTTESRSTLRNREHMLLEHDAFFRLLVNGGAILFRQDDGASSARRIVRHLINVNRHRGPPPALAIQRELVDQNKRLDNTAAGRVVLDEVARKYNAAMEEIALLRLAIRQSDYEGAMELREMKEEKERMIRQLSKTEAQMAICVPEVTRREQQLLIQKLHDAHMKTKAQIAAHERQLSRLEAEKRELQRRASANSRRGSSHRYDYEESPPNYEEAVEKKQAEVVEKQAEVAVSKKRKFAQDAVIAAIPAILAAIVPAVVACTVM